MCSSCFEEYEDTHDDSDDSHSHFVYNYSYKPHPHFYPCESPTLLYFGVELETDGYDSCGLSCAAEDLAALSDGGHLFYLKEDSSLHRGMEIVTHPATLEYHRKIFPWNTIQEIVYTNGGRSHDTTTCGLHFHFNASYLTKEVDTNQWYRQVRKLMALFQRNYVFLYKFSRRSSTSYTEALPLFKPSDSLERVKDYKRGRHSRSHIVNICPRHSVEIRLFRGTLRHETMIAAMELVDYMVRFAKRSSWATINNTSWEDLVSKMKAGNYEYLPSYLAQMPESANKGDGVPSSAPLPTELVDEAPPPKPARKKKATEEGESLFFDGGIGYADFAPSSFTSSSDTFSPSATWARIRDEEIRRTER